jgi:hypothetical protein
MTQFEYLFTLFGLLLGLILVQVLSGLVGLLQFRRHAGRSAEPAIRIGWLTPLLGTFIIFDVTGWWSALWDVREIVPFDFDVMFLGVIQCSVYYFAASMVFPRDPQLWPDLDEWFWSRRRAVLSCVLIVNVIWTIVAWFVRSDAPRWFFVVNYLIYYSALLTAMFARRQRLVASSLVVLILLFLSYIALSYIVRNFGWPF